MKVQFQQLLEMQAAQWDGEKTELLGLSVVLKRLPGGQYNGTITTKDGNTYELQPSDYVVVSSDFTWAGSEGIFNALFEEVEVVEPTSEDDSIDPSVIGQPATVENSSTSTDNGENKEVSTPLGDPVTEEVVAKKAGKAKAPATDTTEDPDQGTV